MIFGQVVKENYKNMESILPADFSELCEQENYFGYAAFSQREDKLYEVLGTITVSIHEHDRENYAVVEWIYVRPEKRHEGVGDFLYNELIDALHDAHINIVFPAVTSNDDAYRTSDDELIHDSEDTPLILPRFFALEEVIAKVFEAYKIKYDYEFGLTFLIKNDDEETMIFISTDYDDPESYAIVFMTEVSVGDEAFDEVLKRFDNEPSISQIELSDAGEKYSITAFLPCESGMPDMSDFIAFFDSYNTDILRFKSILSD